MNGTAGVGAPGGGPVGIEVAGVRAAYGQIEVLHGVDLSVPPGSVYALLGPNGAGKSTLLKVIGGRMDPSVGSVSFSGLDVRRATPTALARAGVCAIPEGRAIFPNLTVRENVRMWTYQRRVTKSAAEDITFSRFPQLKTRRRQLAGTLSGGEQQMLAIARALVGEPRVLLLDEISMGLAPLIVSELYELVRSIADDGVTVVLVEQFVSTAMAVATDAAIMLHGRVHRSGSPEEMRAAAQGAYLTGA